MNLFQLLIIEITRFEEEQTQRRMWMGIPPDKIGEPRRPRTGLYNYFTPSYDEVEYDEFGNPKNKS